MAKLLKKHSRKIGLPPGSLIYTGIPTDKQIEISLVDYDANHVKEFNNASLEECIAYLKTPATTWIHICGIHDIKVVEQIGKHFGLHSLMLEDIVTSGQRSKLDDYKDNIYIVMRLLKYDEEKNEIEDEQVSFILGSNFLLSFSETKKDLYEPVKERIRNKNSRITHRGADYLCYSLIDCTVDHYFLILEKVDEQLENLEEELVQDPNPNTLKKIQQTKRSIALLRKSVWPTRGVINLFRRLETPLIQETTKIYMQDVYDHTIQAIDTIESFRDLSSGLLDIYLSNINLRMNEVMKVLTIVATIFVPLTFIASIYGMNFEYIPELHYRWGYPMVLGFMLFVTCGMLYYFRRKQWI
jgi:magnesium transporter